MVVQFVSFFCYCLILKSLLYAYYFNSILHRNEEEEKHHWYYKFVCALPLFIIESESLIVCLFIWQEGKRFMVEE